MAKHIYDSIKNQESLIEEKRLAIRDIKNEKKRMHNKMDTIGNVYEYLVTPLCAVSIALVALFSGPIIYVLPSVTAVGAISAVSYKFSLRRKIDKLNSKLEKLKDDRRVAYEKREKAYEDIFDNLRLKGKDINDYYHQIVKASKECDNLTEEMIPLKQKKKKMEKVRNFISRLFDYGLAPLGAVVLPLICAFSNVGTIGEVAMMTSSSAVLLGCATIDDKLTKEIDEIDDTISDIKSDRTVKYVKRDLKLNEALEFLKKSESQVQTQNLANKRIINNKKEKVGKR